MPNIRKRNIVLILVEIIIVVLLIKFQYINDFTRTCFTNVFYLLLFLNYIWVIVYSIKPFISTHKNKQLNITLWFILTVTGFLGMGIVFWLGIEDTIKQYDAIVYWLKGIDMNYGMYKDMLGTLKIVQSSLASDYGNLPSLLLVPFFRYFGQSNILFCSSIYIIYGVPSAILLSVYVMRLIDKFEFVNKSFNEYIIVLVMFLSPAMIQPILCGYIDIAGIVWMGILLNLSLDWESECLTVKRDILFSIISVILLFTRRWYAFYIIGFYMAFGVERIVEILLKRCLDWKKTKNLLLNLILIAGLSCVIITILNRNTFSVFLNGNYGEAYSAYKTRPVIMDFIVAAGNIGMLFDVFVLIGMIVLFIRTNTYRYGIRTLTAPFIAGILFGRVQSMGRHHMYLLIPSLLIFQGVGLCFILSKIKLNWRRIAITVCCGVLLWNMGISFFPSLNNARGGFSNIRRYSEVMKNKKTIQDITEYLVKCDKMVYICGEGGDFSAELFNRCFMPDETVALPKMLNNSIVDLRDGFPSQVFLADYIVIRDPYRTDFEETQQVTYQIWNMLINSEYSKLYYKLDKEYKLADDVGNIKVYKKINDVQPDIVTYVSNQIKQYYENNTFVYKPDWFIALANFGTNDEVAYDKWNKSFDIHSSKQISELKLNVNNQFSKLSFGLSADLESDIYTINIYGDDSVIYQTDKASEKSNFDVDIAGYNKVKIELIKHSTELGGWHLSDVRLQ